MWVQVSCVWRRPTLRLTYRRRGGRWSAERIHESRQGCERKARAAVRCRCFVRPGCHGPPRSLKNRRGPSVGKISEKTLLMEKTAFVMRCHDGISRLVEASKTKFVAGVVHRTVASALD